MNKLRIHSIRHVPYEGLGRIENWVQEQKHEHKQTSVYLDEKFPAVEELDWLVVMGGPMGVYQKTEHTWIEAELKFIESCMAAGKTVIGICLGCQLIAEVLGSTVYKGEQGMEIGWYPVKLTPEGQNSSFFYDFPPRV